MPGASWIGLEHAEGPLVRVRGPRGHTDEIVELLFHSGAVSGTVSDAGVHPARVGRNAAHTSGPGYGDLAGGQLDWTIYLLRWSREICLRRPVSGNVSQGDRWGRRSETLPGALLGVQCPLVLGPQLTAGGGDLHASRVAHRGRDSH